MEPVPESQVYGMHIHGTSPSTCPALQGERPSSRGSEPEITRRSSPLSFTAPSRSGLQPGENVHRRRVGGAAHGHGGQAQARKHHRQRAPGIAAAEGAGDGGHPRSQPGNRGPHKQGGGDKRRRRGGRADAVGLQASIHRLFHARDGRIVAGLAFTSRRPISCCRLREYNIFAVHGHNVEMKEVRTWWARASCTRRRGQQHHTLRSDRRLLRPLRGEPAQAPRYC